MFEPQTALSSILLTVFYSAAVCMLEPLMIIFDISLKIEWKCLCWIFFIPDQKIESFKGKLTPNEIFINVTFKRYCLGQHLIIWAIEGEHRLAGRTIAILFSASLSDVEK